ncbi:MAG: bifunctional 4'-phosphopantothenoylcysteine decarboxylase/phosphopantothenoylcysteine synthetase, partial [Firmicutes bacterium]|nr:bifunctional 4'-phosphopantothenoylcysteine decarboxylase/phosphopantothenoylcysteine synthetase [Bacillota bacterium]
LVIKAAAVADYRPGEVSPQKIKKQGQAMQIELTRNPDILAELGRRKKAHQLLVGFAAETNDLEQNALAKLTGKNLDLLVANDVTLYGAGFDHDTNVVRIFGRDGVLEALPLMDKNRVAQKILDRAAKLLQSRGAK